jgi:hypothetical protein
VIDGLNAALPGSWLARATGCDPDEIDHLRREGELFARRENGSGEWLYPAWQFGPGGKVPRGVRRVVKAARDAGLDEARLAVVLARRVGMTGQRRLRDLLFEGDGEYVAEQVRAAATA